MTKALAVLVQRGGIIGAALLALGLLVASWRSVAWATPPQDPLRQTAPTPAAGQTVAALSPTQSTTITTVAGDIQVSVPAGAVTEANLSAVLTPRTVDSLGAAPTGFRFLGHAFNLDIYRELTRVAGFTFARPITICITYTDADLAAAGNDPSNFIILQIKDNGDIVSHTPRVDAANRRVCIEVTALSTFVLATKTPVALPPVGAGGLQDGGNGPLGALLALAAAAALLTGGILRFRRLTR